MGRMVEVYKWERNKDTRKLEKVFKYIGRFHQFGVDYEEFDTGAGNFSTAIVEKDDGTVENVYIEMIKFIDK